jgi:hypothetical protein
LVPELNLAAAKVAREAADACTDRRVFVAGAIGPLNRTLSISRDVNDPGRREVTFEQVASAYTEQIENLVAAGVDILLVETIFDTLNAKAALFAIARFFERHPRLPVMASGTITDLSGRTLTGQTVEAFLNSLSHFPLLSIGLNCALGPKEMRPYIEELSNICTDFCQHLSECRPPDPALANRISRNAREPCPTAQGMGGTRLAQHHRWMLRHDAGSHQSHCGCGSWIAATPHSRPHHDSSPERSGAIHGPPGNSLHQYRREDECDRLAKICEIDPRRKLRRGPCRRPPTG